MALLRFLVVVAVAHLASCPPGRSQRPNRRFRSCHQRSAPRPCPALLLSQQRQMMEAQQRRSCIPLVCRDRVQGLAPPLRTGRMGRSFAWRSVCGFTVFVRRTREREWLGHGRLPLSLSNWPRAADTRSAHTRNRIPRTVTVPSPIDGLFFYRDHSPRLVPFLGTTLFVALTSVSQQGHEEAVAVVCTPY